jgi:hypothetical protein
MRTAPGGFRAIRAHADDDADAEVVPDTLIGTARCAHDRLAELGRALEQVTASMEAARQAGGGLSGDLKRLRDLLESGENDRLGLDLRVAELTSELTRVRSQATQERNFLVDEQDRFLAGLLEEHEEQLRKVSVERDELVARVGALERASARAGPSDPEARAKIEKLTLERERSRDLLRRLQAQRDEAQAEVAELNRKLETALTEIESLRTVPQTSVEDGRSTQPADRARENAGLDSEWELPRVGERPTLDVAPKRGKAAPAEARAFAQALDESRSAPLSSRGEDSKRTQPNMPAALASMKKPPPKAKPDPIQRPLGGYAVSGEDMGPERVQRSSSKPPRR